MAEITKLEARFIKSNFYRVIHVDGIFGGIAPTGQIHASLFSQRAAIPDSIEFSIGPAGSILKEELRHGGSGLVRELEIDAVFDLNTATAIRKWLDEKIQALEKLNASQKSQESEK